MDRLDGQMNRQETENRQTIRTLVPDLEDSPVSSSYSELRQVIERQTNRLDGQTDR